MLEKKHYEAIKDVHVNLENRNHAIDEYGYGPLSPKEKNDDFWNEKAKLWNTSVEEAKKSRCYNCAAFNRSEKILKDMSDSLGPAGDKIVDLANLGFCEFFKFKCAGERTCDAWITNGPIEEEAPANATGPAIPGTGDDPQAFPRGEPLKKYKRRSKGEQEDQTMDIAMMRRATPMMEAPLLTYIGKKRKFNRETGRQFPEEKSGDKVARIDSEHDLHYKNSADGSTYMVRNRKTGVVHATIFGYPKRKAGTFEINATDSTGQGPKMHKVYRKILQSGHAKSLVGTSHSEGGQKIWQKLSRERGVNIHGWVGGKKGKPVNLDPRDPEETHVSYDDAYDSGDAAAKEILRTKLVATMAPKKKIVRKRT